MAFFLALFAHLQLQKHPDMVCYLIREQKSSFCTPENQVCKRKFVARSLSTAGYLLKGACWLKTDHKRSTRSRSWRTQWPEAARKWNSHKSSTGPPNLPPSSCFVTTAQFVQGSWVKPIQQRKNEFPHWEFHIWFSLRTAVFFFSLTIFCVQTKDFVWQKGNAALDAKKAWPIMFWINIVLGLFHQKISVLFFSSHPHANDSVAALWRSCGLK